MCGHLRHGRYTYLAVGGSGGRFFAIALHLMQIAHSACCRVVFRLAQVFNLTYIRPARKLDSKTFAGRAQFHQQSNRAQFEGGSSDCAFSVYVGRFNFSCLPIRYSAASIDTPNSRTTSLIEPQPGISCLGIMMLPAKHFACHSGSRYGGGLSRRILRYSRVPE